MRRSLTVGLSLLCCLLFSGCLEFEEQVLTYHYDQKSDTIRIFQDYHGIFGASAKDASATRLSTEEMDQLQSVLKGQRTFFFSNWILEFNREELSRSLADLKSPEKSSDQKLSAAGVAKMEKLLQQLLANVQVTNGPFYFNKQGKLCGVQYVTVTKFSEVVAAANEFAPFFITSESVDKPADDASAMKRFAKNPKQLIEFRGNAITVRWPMAKSTYQENFGNRTRAAELKRGGLTTSFADDVVTIKIGKSSEQISRLALGFSTNTYAGNLVASAKAQHTIKDKFDPAADGKRFLLNQRK